VEYIEPDVEQTLAAGQQDRMARGQELPEGLASVRTVAMLGTSAGGLATVAETIIAAWSDERYRIVPIVTHENGGPFHRVALAARACARLALMLARREVDLVHVHFAAYGSAYRKSVFVDLARAFGVPVIGHAHDGRFPAFYANGSDRRREWIVRFLAKFDRLVVLSEEWRIFYQGLCPDLDTIVIGNGVPPAAEHVPGDGPPVILVLGRMCRDKGTYDALACLPSVLERHPDAELWLAGDGEVEAVMKAVASMSLERSVRVLGWIAGDVRETVMQKARVLILPSHAEGMPMALLEAMSRGIPVVATSVGAVPGIVRNGENGLLVRPCEVEELAQAIVRLLSDPIAATAMGKAGRSLVEQRYSVKAAVDVLAQLYDGTVGNRMVPR
jgi:glycosyltransferase involved in cell wall biosynthesis